MMARSIVVPLALYEHWPVTVVLLIALAILFFLYITLIRSRFFDRVVGLLAMGTLAVFAVRPDWSDALANWVGIGRGVDLLFYLSHAFIGFVLLHLFVRGNRQQEQIAGLVRQQALMSARTRPEESPESQR